MKILRNNTHDFICLEHKKWVIYYFMITVPIVQLLILPLKPVGNTFEKIKLESS